MAREDNNTLSRGQVYDIPKQIPPVVEKSNGRPKTKNTPRGTSRRQESPTSRPDHIRPPRRIPRK